MLPSSRVNEPLSSKEVHYNIFSRINGKIKKERGVEFKKSLSLN